MSTLVLKSELVSGTPRIYPNCAVSKAIVSAMGKNCLNIREISDLADVFEIEYTGLRSVGLDSLGVKFKQ